MPEETPGTCLSPGIDTAYTPRRDDIQRLALMIYSHKRLTIYTASRDYGDKRVPSSRAKSRDPLRRSRTLLRVDTHVDINP